MVNNTELPSHVTKINQLIKNLFYCSLGHGLPHATDLHSLKKE